MSLPRNEYFPDDPDMLPPARRRRARRLLAPLDADERAAALDVLARRTSPTFDFYLFSLLAGAVLSAGLLLDSPALLVLGAVLSPLMSPVVGVSLGTVVGSARFFGRSLVGLVIGSGLVFAVGTLAGYVAQAWMPLELSQAYHHAQLSWVSFILLAVGAVFTAAAMVHTERSPSAPSVALAYTIYLPLAVAGFGLGSATPHLWPDGLVLFALHLSWAALFGAITLAVLGFRPLTLFGYTLGGVVTLVGVILLIGFSGFSAVLGAFGQPLAVPTYTPTTTFTLTPVPPTPTITLTPVPPTDTPTFTPSPVPTDTFTPPPSSTPVPVYALIAASEESGGVFLRAEAGFTGRAITILSNGTLVQLLPDAIEADGYLWAHIVVLSDGTDGWVLQSLLLVATPAPDW